jgi:hypothetical protein
MWVVRACGNTNTGLCKCMAGIASQPTVPTFRASLFDSIPEFFQALHPEL